MKTKLYLFSLAFAALCFQACEKTDEMETTEEAHSLLGEWELIDFSGVIEETANKNSKIITFETLESNYSINFGTDYYLTKGIYTNKVIEIKNNDTLSIGILDYVNPSVEGNYTSTDTEIMINHGQFFGISPISDLTYTDILPVDHFSNEPRLAKFTIENDILSITQTEEDVDVSNNPTVILKVISSWKRQ